MTIPANAGPRRHRLDWLAVLSAAVAATAALTPATAPAKSNHLAALVAPVCQPWDAGTAYVQGDTVTEGGKSYPHWPRQTPLHRDVQQPFDPPLARRGPGVARPAPEQHSGRHENRNGDEDQHRGQG